MTSAPGRSWPRLLAAALGQPGLRPLVAAQFVSLTGSQITALALPTLAVLRLDAGPLAAGLLFALGYGMRGLTAPLVGVLVDSIRSPRRLLVGTDLVHAVVMASVPATYLLDLLSLPYLLVVAAISGILAGVTDIAVNAVLPRLVPADQLVDANSSLTGARATGQIIGPALGGMLLQFLGAILAVVVDAVSYLLSAALFGGLRGAERPASADAPTARGRPAVVRWRGGDLLGSARAGLRTFRGDPLLIRLALAAAALNVGGAGLGALYTLYAYRSLGLSPSQVGAMWAVHSGAALLAVATASRVVRRLGLNGAVAGLAPVAAAALLLIPAASLATPLLLFVVYEVIFGYCATVWTIASMTLQQRLVPAELLGRVIAFGRSIMILAIPIGAIGGGLAARWWGLLPTLVGFAIIALVGTTTVTVRIFGRSGGGSPPRYDPATQHRDPAWEHLAPPAQQSSGQHGTTYRE